MKYIQDFIETYYPNYHSCSQIARWNGLCVILDDEHVEGINYTGIIPLHEFTTEWNDCDEDMPGFKESVLDTFISYVYICNQ